MLSLLLILNVMVAVLGGRALFGATRYYIVWFLEAVFVLFFVIRPFLNGILLVPDPELLMFGIDGGPILSYTLCGLVFALVFHPTVLWLYGRQKLVSDHFFRLCNFENVSKSRFAIVFSGFVALNYALNAFKFHSLSYVFSRQDSFEAGMALSGGLWFIQMMSSVLIFPCLVLMAKSLDAKPVRLLCILFFTMAGFVVIVHPSDRTGIIGLLLAVVIYVASTGRFRGPTVTSVVMIVGVAAVVVILMLFLNYLRLDAGPTDTQESILVPIVGSFWADTLPAANAMVLIEYQKHHDWVYFRYLLPSLLPISTIPSKIFPYKPPVGIEITLTSSIFGLHLDPELYHEGGTLAFTVPGAGYADLGYIGVVVAALLYGTIFAVYLRGWKSKVVTVRFMTLYFLILVVAGLRLSDSGLMTINYWILISTSLLYLAAHFTLSPSVAGPKSVPVARRHEQTGKWVFALCALAAVCLTILVGYVLTS